MNIIGKPFIELPRVDSTNIYAMQQAHARLATPGTVYFAHEQTSGKGQRNRKWTSEPGKNLMMSAVINAPFSDPGKQFLLSCATALACYDFFKIFAGDETAIKWPNDIYWRDRKAGGILIENIIRNSLWDMAVIGIGININQASFDPELRNPVSLLQITGKIFNTVELAHSLCSELSNRVNQLNMGNTDELNAEYNQILFKRGQQIKFRKDGLVIKGIFDRVDNAGNLVLVGEREEIIQFGTAEWILS
ncbi:biotin--[acetyl-CoA-carboxylase] ligase [Pollutibacter soli]|uniref:biotin--[acetyl-CoA-carboxylase] ligase n=1 Tax=Pollutibacter soli TaxID=3034157 RepID=UPI0030140957